MKKSIIITMLAAAVLCACDKNYYREGYYDDKYYQSSKEVLTLRNFSSDETVWFVPEQRYAESLPMELSEWDKISVCQVGPHSSYTLDFDSKDNYVTPIETYGPGDRMSIYVFKKSVWEKYSWQEIVEGRMWCGHCTLSVDEAVKLDGIVTYPMR